MFRSLQQFPANSQSALRRRDADRQDFGFIGGNPRQDEALLLGDQPEHAGKAHLSREHFGAPGVACGEALAVHFGEAVCVAAGGADHPHGGGAGVGRNPPAGNLASGGST